MWNSPARIYALNLVYYSLWRMNFALLSLSLLTISFNINIIVHSPIILISRTCNSLAYYLHHSWRIFFPFFLPLCGYSWWYVNCTSPMLVQRLGFFRIYAWLIADYYNTHTSFAIFCFVLLVCIVQSFCSVSAFSIFFFFFFLQWRLNYSSRGVLGIERFRETSFCSRYFICHHSSYAFDCRFFFTAFSWWLEKLFS